ncbi:hypothetical protein FQR65_LT03370 [Abscondita terminalis]|nr:hypothetical protein FQR65_LT03370 [Abscondita terminalis]
MQDRTGQLIGLLIYVNWLVDFGLLQTLGPSDQPEAYFNGSSYIRLQTTISLKRHTSFSFRSCIGGELLTQKHNDNTIELSINTEGLAFVIHSGGRIFDTKIIGNYLNNKWHIIHIEYKLGNLTLSIDDQTQLIANATYQTEILNNPNLYNDGAILIVGNHFVGCILEGPSVIFNNSFIHPHNVQFGLCPIPLHSCIPKEDIKSSRAIDYCINEPCMGQGVCINGQNSYSCICSPRYSGKNCEIDLGNFCDKKPSVCKNGATCIEINGNYKCNCPQGFIGTNCEQEVAISPLCTPNPCVNNGVCVVHTGSSRTQCNCLSGFTGPLCEVNINECQSNPCLNNGYCKDGNDSYSCDCSYTGYGGKNCEVNIDECRTNPCQNYGTCYDTYGSFTCLCPPGYDGKSCQYNVDECISQPCLNDGQCINKLGGYECRCQSGYAGRICELEVYENPCLPPNCSTDTVCINNPCLNGGTCNPLTNSYNCTCPPGFTGNLCNASKDGCASNPCSNGGLCIENFNGFFCNCSEQWMGVTCDEPFNICKTKPCLNNSTCIASANKREYTCNCLKGFGGKKCEINIDDCHDVKCPPGQVCVDYVDEYECRCPTGYTGENCSVLIDPCLNIECANGGTCTYDNLNTYATCICLPGANCDTDINECDYPGVSVCNHGYSGETCSLDFDECLSMPCRNNATCLNKVNNFECVCPPGYTGKDCSININECEPMPCVSGSTCIDGINEYTCICLPGLTGRQCEINIDDCESSPCLNGAHCIDGLNSYTCNCSDTGFVGTHCEININDCIGNPCQNGGQCIDEIKNYRCQCYPGYTGKNCEEDINECESSPCKHFGLCLEKSNRTLYESNILSSINITLPEVFNRSFHYSDAAGYECLCLMGVTGRNCEININECESSPCLTGSCVDKIGGYICECDEGFEGEHCEIDIDECEKYQPCKHGLCMDRRANYYCDCESDYGGKNCSVLLTGCLENPCSNSGTCKPYLINETEHRFNCSCSNGFHGDTCEKVTTMSLSGHSLVIVNTTREEGYDIQFRFKTTLGDGLLALGKGLTYYILELSRGRLNLHSSLLNKWEGVFIGSNLNDSNWQKVFVAINSSHLVLSANDEQTIYPITFNENYNVSSTSFPTTFIGGIPSNLRKLTHEQPFLVGCLEDVLINNEWVLPEVQNFSGMGFQNVEVGCHREPQCNPNPCYSGGHCTDKWRDFSCTCERPHLGRTCQYNYTAATFGYENITSSLVTVTVADAARRAVRSIVDISMFIRTRQSGGQIFYLGSALTPNNIIDETFIAAQLEGGELLVRIQFNGTPESYTVGGVKLNDGYNHLIEVIRNVTLIQVKLNGTEYFRKTISSTGTLDAQVLFLGGQPQLRPVRQAADSPKADLTATTGAAAAVATPLSMIHFKGIIQDVQVSNGSKIMVVEFFPLKVEELDIPTSFGTVSFDNFTIRQGVLSDDSCKNNPCKHGTCVNTWNDYRCICERGFKGKDCTEVEFCELERCPEDSQCKNLEDGYECIANATFDGHTPPLIFNLVRRDTMDNLFFDFIELTYRTKSWGTILFAKHLENHFIVFVYHDQVIVDWNIGDDMQRRNFYRENFDGQWLTLHFEFKDRIIKGGFKEMITDDAPNFVVDNFDYVNFTEIFSKGIIYIGGSDNKTFNYPSILNNDYGNGTTYFNVMESTTDFTFTSNAVELPENGFTTDSPPLYRRDINKTSDRFKGCLGEIRIGKLLLPFYITPKLYRVDNYPHQYFDLHAADDIIGCQLCYNTDCLNGGRCNDPTNTYKCQCPDGFAADDCSIDINECENNNCQNNATCIDKIAAYECRCVDGFDGIFCEHEIDECESNPCRHNGTCIDLLGAFKCDCPEDYVGKQCEAIRIITCENRPCHDKAVCVDGRNVETGNNFTCICSEGFVGTLCDRAYCSHTPCQNGGKCNVTQPSPSCFCERGFDGKYCEVNIDDCFLPTLRNPCLNGGICIDGINRYDCNCTNTGFSGLLCELDIDECKIEDVCGVGKCINLQGSYECECPLGSCGFGCEINDPCQSNPCEHGECRSKCTNVADYICNCEEHWIGKNCSDNKLDAQRTGDSINILYIIIPVVIIILVGFLVAAVVLVNMARSKRATRGTYSPSAQEFCNPRVELDHVLKPPPEERLI